MPDQFRLTMAQMNPTVGDLVGNADKAFAAWQMGVDAGSDMVVCPEMFLIGYHAIRKILPLYSKSFVFLEPSLLLLQKVK